MNYKNAYCHMFNQITNLTALIEAEDGNKEMINIASALKRLQIESEEICIGGATVHAYKAARCGSTKQ